jgi:hypothetical protein
MSNKKTFTQSLGMRLGTSDSPKVAILTVVNLDHLLSHLEPGTEIPQIFTAPTRMEPGMYTSDSVVLDVGMIAMKDMTQKYKAYRIDQIMTDLQWYSLHENQ